MANRASKAKPPGILRTTGMDVIHKNKLCIHTYLLNSTSTKLNGLWMGCDRNDCAFLQYAYTMFKRACVVTQMCMRKKWVLE